MRAAGRGRAEAGRDPDTPRSPLPSSPRHLAPPRCPAPFPTWIPGRLANSLLREAGRGAGDSIQSDSSRRRFYTPALLGFYRRRAPHPASGGERCVLSQGAGAGMARPQAHTAPGAEFPKTPTPPLIPSAPKPVSAPTAPKTQAAPAPHSEAGQDLHGPRGHPARPGAGARVGRTPPPKTGVAATTGARACTSRASRVRDRT